MIKRILAGVIGVGSALNGVVMLVTSQRWYDTVPGVSHTGPFNPHFVLDVGFAYVVSGLSLAAFAWRPEWRLAAVTGAAFFVAHGGLHVVGLAMGDAHIADAFLVVLPAALAVWAVWPDKTAAAGA